VELLTHAVVPNFSEARKRGLSDDCAETPLNLERLQELCSPHGLSQSENTVRALVGFEPLEPAAYVVTLEQAIGSVNSAAYAMSAGVGHQNAVAMVKEKLRVTDCAQTIVAEPVEQNDGIAIPVPCMNVPGAQQCGIERSNLNAL